jgi:hypothetical protein
MIPYNAVRPALLICLIGSLIPSAASAQIAANTIRRVRPLVDISFQNPMPAGDPLALGIFDTGNDTISITPETNSRVGIGVAYTSPSPPVPAGQDPALYNDAIVGKPTDITVGGFLGVAVGGPEVFSTAAAPANGRAHIFSTDTRRSAANSYAQTGFAPSLTYFGAIASLNGLNNIGTAFIARTGGQSALVTEVDPTQGGYLPFALNNVTRAGLNAPSLPLNQTYSSLSFYAINNVQVPTSAANANPSFLSVLNLSDGENTNPGVNPNFQRQTTQPFFPNPTPPPNNITDTNSPGTTTGGLPMVVIGPGNPFGITAANFATYIADTGAPTTQTPTPANPNPLLGTDNLNGFGQYWNFQTSQLLLFGPRKASDQNIVGPGILFNVDRSTVGLASTGVNQLAVNGLTPVMNAPNPTPAGAPPPTPNPNPNGAPTIYQSAAPEQSAAIFRTQLTHSNATYVSGIDALNLSNRDQLLALSLGADTIPNPVNAPLGARTNGILFAVDRNSQGLADDPTALGGGVQMQTALGKQSANVYASTTGNRLPSPGVNAVKYSGDLLGLGPNAGPAAAAAGRGQVDQLRDFVVQSQNGYYNANVNSVQRNVDPPVTYPGDNRNPGASVAGNYGVRADVYGLNFDTYFTLDKASPSRAAAGVSAADILVNNVAGGGTGFHAFAGAATLGLNPNDQINTLAFSRPLNHPTQTIPLQPGVQNISMSLVPGTGFDPNIDGMFDNIDPFHGNISDLALFTLGPGSPDLGIFDPVIGATLSSADVFVTDFDGTFSLYDTAESLGLNPLTDTITGMKPLPVDSVPEPTTLALVVLALPVMLLAARRGGKRQRRSN